MVNKDSYVALRLLNRDAIACCAQTTSQGMVAFDGTASFSILAWIKPNDFGEMFSVFKQNGIVDFYIEKGLMTLAIQGFPLAQVSDASTITEAVWNHVCVTFRSGRCDFYLNGFHSGASFVKGICSGAQSPLSIGTNSNGFMRSLRVYDEFLDAATVKKCMYEPAETSCLMDLDFSQNPPKDRKNPARVIELLGSAKSVICYPALQLLNTAYAMPTQAEHINPGGQQLDSYTLQTTILVVSTESPQMIYCSGSLEEPSGIALFIEYDVSKNGFIIKSLRGSITQTQNILSSNAVISLGQWYNIAVRFNGVEHSLFIDGEKDAFANTGPILLSRIEGKLMIGARIDADRLTGSNSLQGYLSFLSVWEKALSEADIKKYMTEMEDATTPELLALYDFNTEPVENTVDGSPVSLNAGAHIGEKTDVLTMAYKEAEPRAFQSHDDCLDPAFLLRCRESMSFSDEPSKFYITRHTIDEAIVLIVHFENESYVAYRGDAQLSDCAWWRIELIFIILSGVMFAVTGVKLSLTDKAISIISKSVFTLPTVAAALAAGTSINTSQIFGIFKDIYNAGVLKELVKSMILSIGFWAMIGIIANIFQVVTGLKIAGILVVLAGTVTAFIYKYTQKPASCSPPSAYVLSEIRFYNGPNSSIPVRKNYENALKLPEWTTSRSALPELYGANNICSTPVAYTRAQIEAAAGIRIIVQIKTTARFGNHPPIQVKATNTGAPVLGSIAAFAIWPNEFTEVTIGTGVWNGIRRNVVEFEWEYCADGAWKRIGNSLHVVYSLADVPNALLWETNYLPPNQPPVNLPWTDALDFACEWANGAVDADAAARMITEVLHEDILGPRNVKLRYTAENTYVDMFAKIKLGRFLQALIEGITLHGNGSEVNCSACAGLLMAFANLVGCNLSARQFKKDAPGQSTQHTYLKIIGYNTWHPPDTFKYHEIAWQNETNVYDPCIKLDATENPWQARAADSPNATILPGQPAMRFKTQANPTVIVPPYIATDSYRERFFQNTLEAKTGIIENVALHYRISGLISGRAAHINSAQIGNFLLTERAVISGCGNKIEYELLESYRYANDTSIVLEVTTTKYVADGQDDLTVNENGQGAILQAVFDQKILKKSFCNNKLKHKIICRNPEAQAILDELAQTIMNTGDTLW